MLWLSEIHAGYCGKSMSMIRSIISKIKKYRRVYKKAEAGIMHRRMLYAGLSKKLACGDLFRQQLSALFAPKAQTPRPAGKAGRYENTVRGAAVDCQVSAAPKKTSKGVRQPNLLRGL